MEHLQQRRPRTGWRSSAALLAGLLIAAGTASVTAQTVFPVTPDPTLCQGAPRPAADFEQFLGNSAVSLNVGQAAASPAPFVPPVGEPADAATVAAVEALAVQLFACYNANDFRRAYALLTDRGLADFLLAPPQLTEDDVAFLLATPGPAPADLRIELLNLYGTTVLPDGRIGSFLDIRYPDGAQTQYGFVTVLGGRYRLDEVVYFGPLIATPTP